MSTDEKKKLQEAFTSLPLEDLDKALKIVAQNNPSFQATTYEVDLDMDSQVMIYKLLYDIGILYLPYKLS